MSVMDDVCATMHAQTDGADSKLLEVRTNGSSELTFPADVSRGDFQIKFWTEDVYLATFQGIITVQSSIRTPALNLSHNHEHSP